MKALFSRFGIAAAFCIALPQLLLAGNPNFETPSPTLAPEFDGPAGITAIALLAGIVALAYQRARR